MKFLYFLAVLILFSCNNASKNNQEQLKDSLNTSSLGVKPNHKEVLYYEDGQIKFVQEYFNGIKHGAYKNWYEDGIIRTLGAYDMGFRKGMWSWYNDKGTIEFQVNYDKQVASL